jgi:hypothetical protein
MRSTKIANCIFLILLILSSSFIQIFLFSIHLTEATEATCDAICQEEKEKWPSIAYCSNPLNVEYQVGESIVHNQMQWEDLWTASAQSIAYYWIADQHTEFSTDRLFGQYSFYGISSKGEFKFSLYQALNLHTLGLSIYDQLNFWFKSDYNGKFDVWFNAEDDASWDKRCDFGEYKAEYGWKNYSINLADCGWISERKPIKSIIFKLDTGNPGWGDAYIDGLNISSTPVVENKQYFVYAGKPNNDISVELNVGGINPLDSSFVIENLNSNVARWDSGKGKIIVENNGTFIIHYSSSNTLTLTPSTGIPINDNKIQIQGTSECSSLVKYMVYLQETGRQKFVSNQNPIEAFGGVVFAGLEYVYSQLSNGALKEPDKWVNIPELYLKAAQDIGGADNVLIGPAGSMTYVYTGRDTFPYVRMKDIEIVTLVDDSYGLNNQGAFLYETLQRFKIYAEQKGLTVYLPADYPSFVSDQKVIVKFPDGKAFAFDTSVSYVLQFSDLKDTEALGRNTFIGNENAKAKLGSVLKSQGIDVNFVENKMADWYKTIYAPTKDQYGGDNGYSIYYWSELDGPGANYHVGDVNVIEGPEKTYKMLAFLSQARGEGIEIQNTFLERYDYWHGEFITDYIQTGEYRPETLQAFRDEIRNLIDIDYYPYDQSVNIKDMTWVEFENLPVSQQIHSLLGSNLYQENTAGGGILFRLKNAISDLLSFRTTKDPAIANLEVRTTTSHTQNELSDLLEEWRKELNDIIDNIENAQGKDLVEVEVLEAKSSRLLNVPLDSIENGDKIKIAAESINYLAKRTGLDLLSNDMSPERVANLKQNLLTTNSVVDDVLLETRAKAGTNVGEVKLDLDDMEYEPTQKATDEVKEGKQKLYTLSDNSGGTVENEAEKAELTAINKASNSDVAGKVPDEAIEPKSFVLEKYGGFIFTTAIIAIFAIGPLLNEYGQKYHNALYLTAGLAIQIGGFVAISYLFISQWMVTHSIITAVFSTIALIAEPMNILSGGGGIFGLTIDISGFIIFLIVKSFVTFLTCYLNPTSPACGCSPDPAYGKAQFKLERNIVTTGETIEYSVYGMQHCDEQYYLFGIIPITPTYSGVLQRDNIYTGPYVANCYPFGSSCCNNTITIPWNPGTYAIFGRVQAIGGDYPFISTSDSQILTVCPTNTWPDASDNQCVSCDTVSHTESPGRCEEACGASLECDEKSNTYATGYVDDYNLEIPGNGPVSSNQMKGCNGNGMGCTWSVVYDSYIQEVSVNGVTKGDATVSNVIQVVTKINNTGINQQGWWFVGVEFWRVGDYDDPWGTRIESERVDTWFNGVDPKSSGCDPPIPGCGCSYSEPPGPYNNGKFDPGETINVTCWVPASHWSPTNGDERIMFWIHERDPGQDAGNNGCNGDSSSKACGPANGNAGCSSGCPGGGGWSDALSRSYRSDFDDPINGGPAPVRVKIPQPNPVTLYAPVVFPTPVRASESFFIVCPTDVQLDCINAYANDGSNKCSIWGYDAVRHGSMFWCPGMPAGDYNAACMTFGGTPDNCMATSSQTYYNVQTSIPVTITTPRGGGMRGRPLMISLSYTSITIILSALIITILVIFVIFKYFVKKK